MHFIVVVFFEAEFRVTGCMAASAMRTLRVAFLSMIVWYLRGLTTVLCLVGSVSSPVNDRKSRIVRREAVFSGAA